MLNLKKGLLGALPRRLPVYWSTAYILFLHFIETIILATQIFFKIYSHLFLSWLSVFIIIAILAILSMCSVVYKGHVSVYLNERFHFLIFCSMLLILA